MISYGNLYTEICALENLYGAASKAKRHKSRREDVERFEFHRERYVRQLHTDLIRQTWRPSAYRRFEIHDPKRRTICAAPFRDRVVHHALCNVIGPLLERRFTDDSCSCRVGKGTLYGMERCRKYTNRYNYALKCDIKKYFESIDHAVLLEKLGKTIRCKPTLELCRKIIGSEELLAPDTAQNSSREITTIKSRACGLPIGNLTSQLWANLYLDKLDHFIREELRARAYVRYTDDFILWADDKKALADYRDAIALQLETVWLTLHPVKTRILPTHCGVPFLGFRFYPSMAPRLLGKCKRRFERRARRLYQLEKCGKADATAVQLAVNGWKAFANYGNIKGLYMTYDMKGFG